MTFGHHHDFLFTFSVSVERVTSLEEIENQGISTLDLLELVQASETELFNALRPVFIFSHPWLLIG